MRHSRTAASLGWLVALAGCAGGAPADVAAISSALSKCEEIICGSNALLDFYELDSSMNEPSRGARLEAFKSADGRELSLVVEGDRLVGIAPDGRLEGDALLESTLTIHKPTETDADTRYTLRLIKVKTDAHFWVKPEPVFTYHFVFRRAGDPGGWQDFCVVNADDPKLQGHALIYRGDRYDHERLTVTDSSAPGDPWFNIVCLGTAASKLHFMRHTHAGQTRMHRTAIADRQALLKLFTADYCGVGRPFTETGQDLVYMDRFGWYPQPAPPFDDETKITMEAYFTSKGATCLTEARRERIDPWIRAEIDRVCNLAGRPLLPCTRPAPGDPLRYTTGNWNP